jgi:LysR family transcriptional regulator, hydrogen peroxide-inducible genes activator
MSMSLLEMRYLVALADELHFARAATRCHVSQPALSIALKKLEVKLGFTLFERSRQGISVTAAGAPLIAQARRILKHTEQIAALADAAAAKPWVGTVRLGSIASVGPYLLPSLLLQLRQQASGLSLNFEDGDSASLTTQLIAGNLDALVVTAPFRAAGVLTRDLFDEPWALLLPAQHPLVNCESLHIGELTTSSIYYLATETDGLSEYLRARDAAPISHQPQEIPCSSIETLRQLVAAGLGIGILPALAANSPLYAPYKLAVRRFTTPPPSRRLLLAWRASFPRPTLMDLLSQTLQTSASWALASMTLESWPPSESGAIKARL